MLSKLFPNMTKDGLMSWISLILGIIFFIIQMIADPNFYKTIGWYTLSLAVILALMSVAYSTGKRIGSKSVIIAPVVESEGISGKIDLLLISYIQEKMAAKHYYEVVRMSLALSNPLWLSHQYRTRQLIGQIAVEAAFKTNNHRARAKIIIEDIGWMSVELGKYEPSEQEIKRGLKIAEDHHFYDILSVGYRYLFSKYYRQGNLTTAETFLTKANEYLSLIESPEKRKELTAELHFARSSFFLKKGEVDSALQEIATAEEMYEELSDREWKIKIRARKAEVLFAKNDVDSAMDLFRSGLVDSEETQFNRQIVKNKIGYAKCLYANRQHTAASVELAEALKIAETYHMFYEKELVEREQRNQITQ